MSIKQKLSRWVVDKAFGLSQYAQLWLAGLDLPDGKKGKPTKPYSQVELVFACVNKLIDSIAGLPLVLSTIDERIVESGPAWDLLFNNPAMSFERFVTQTIGHYALSRDVFWIFIDTQGIGPKEILVVSGTQMHPITHDRTAAGELLGWEFRGTGGQRVEFTLNEVHQWKNFNPDNRFGGLGPATAAKLSIDYSFAASLYNTSSLENAAEPGVILTAQGRLEPDEVNMLRGQFDARHRGAGQAKRTAVLTGGMDAKTVALKMTDMQVAKISKMADNKICSTFGVPPGVVGLVTEAQYSHGPAQRDFIFNTIMPLARLFAGEITAGMLARFLSRESRSVAKDVSEAVSYHGTAGRLAKSTFYHRARTKAIAARQKIFAWFDVDQHPTVAEANREIAEKVLGYTKSGVPLNDLIEAHDLPYEKTPWGDHWWIGMGQVPASWALEAGPEGITGPSMPEGEGEPQEGKTYGQALLEKYGIRQHASDHPMAKDDAQQRLRLWRNWVVTWAGIEREYKEALRQFFLRQQRILTAKLKDSLPKAVTRDMTDDIIARVVFDLKLEDGKIKVINRTFFDKGGELGARQVISEVPGLAGDELADAAEDALRRPAIKRALTISSHKITAVNKTTQKLIASQLRQGLDAGEGLNDLTARIRTTLGSNRARALSIARTQTAGAVGSGRHVGMQHAGVQLKSWVTSGDEGVRPAHVDAGSRYAEGIAVNLAFQVGGDFLMYPGDPSGSAANIVNCRCVSIAKRAAGRDFDLAYYSNLKFYSYSDMRTKTADAGNKSEGKDNGP